MVKVISMNDDFFICNEYGVYFRIGNKTEAMEVTKQLCEQLFKDEILELSLSEYNNYNIKLIPEITIEDRKNCKYFDELYGCNGCNRVEKGCILKR